MHASDILLHGVRVYTRSAVHRAVYIEGADAIPSGRALRIVDLVVFDTLDSQLVSNPAGDIAPLPAPAP